LRRGRRRAIGPLIALIAFLAEITASPFGFLDGDLFLIVAALILFLLVRQARLLAAAQAGRERAAARAAALSVALEQARRKEAAPRRLSLSGHGAVDSVPLDEIAFVKAAGDYAEAHLCGGGQRLAGKRLSEIEAVLPSTFLRVHRSFLVNLAQVRRLERSASGTGSLFLADGSEIPVSRRIMPKVRKTLEGKEGEEAVSAESA
jgi:DNA-binding LytR/AlgR family response regulator